MIKRDSYDTTAGVGIQIEKVLKDVAEETIHDTVVRPKYILSESYLIAIASKESKKVKPFSHPVFITEERSKKLQLPTNYSVVDLRPFCSGVKDGELLMRDRLGCQLAMLRGELDVLWNMEQSWFKQVDGLAMSAYSAYLSESVARRLMLDPEAQLQLSVIFGLYFYWTLTTDGESTWDDKELLKACSVVSRTTMVSIDVIVDFVDGVTFPVNMTLSGLCEFIRERIPTKRLESLDVPLLYALVSGGWQGANGRQIVAISLEHPPTWMAIVLATLDNKTAQRSQLFETLKRWNKGDAFERYSMSVKRLGNNIDFES